MSLVQGGIMMLMVHQPGKHAGKRTIVVQMIVEIGIPSAEFKVTLKKYIVTFRLPP
jgi:hypothetical protein